MSEVKIVVCFKNHTNYPAYPAYNGQEYWNFKEKLSQDQTERGEKGWEIVIEKKHPCFKEIDLRAKWDENKGDYCSIYELTFDKNAGKPYQGNKKELWFDKEDSIKITTRERERERERTDLKELRERIAELEAIANRTAEQEAELTSKKKELADLEKQQSQDPKKNNWTPWLIGGGIVLVLVVGIIAYLLKIRKKEK